MPTGSDSDPRWIYWCRPMMEWFAEVKSASVDEVFEKFRDNDSTRQKLAWLENRHLVWCNIDIDPVQWNKAGRWTTDEVVEELKKRHGTRNGNRSSRIHRNASSKKTDEDGTHGMRRGCRRKKLD